jgi:DNA polymerase-3 subunit gamma/tau
MAYQVIARKYRPQRFADVVGQEHVTQTLTNAIAQNRIAHAYLFCGPRGTGKTTIARIFAKCLNCTGGPKVDFDEADPRCQEITESRSIDVLEIDGASNNGVEQVRELRETVKYAPASSKFKIYIIDEVHMLSTAAFNALLKTLEEPPSHVKFMFATTDPEKVLPTILSRCQRFDLRRIPISLITQHLTLIATQERVNIEPDALHAIARGAEGGMRDAESALDQLISFCGDRIVEADVLSMFGLTARSQIVALGAAVLQGEAETALRQLNDLARHGKDLGRLLADLLNHFRNLLLYQVSNGDQRLLEVSEVEAASVADQSSLANSSALIRVMEVLTDAEGRLRDASSKKIFVEVALLKAIEARSATSIDSVLRQLQQLRDGGNPTVTGPNSAKQSSVARAGERPLSGGATPVVSAAAPRVAGPGAAATPASCAAPTLSAAPSEAGDLIKLWRDLLDSVGRVSPFAKNYLIEAHPVSLVKNVLTIGLDPEFAEHIDLVNTQKTHALLHTKLSELGCPHTQIKFIQAERPAEWTSTAAGAVSVSTDPVAAPDRMDSPAPPVPTSAPPKRERTSPVLLAAEEIKSDPLIQQALEIFKGRIVEVRS